MALNVIGQTYGIEKKLLLAAAKEVFLYLGEDFEVNLRFVSENTIKELNRVYRKKDEVTDILSFNLDKAENNGDIAICYSELKKDAKALWKIDISKAAGFLLVHGMLHLAGFDHTKPQERAKMEKTENAILDKLRIKIERS